MPPDQLTISQVARLARVNVETIRFYERQGLIASPPRGAGGCRHYSAQAIEQVRFIRQIKQLGFSLPEIGELLNMTNAHDKPLREMEQPLREVMAKVNDKIAALMAMREVLLLKLTKQTGPQQLVSSILLLIDTYHGEEKLDAMKRLPGSTSGPN